MRDLIPWGRQESTSPALSRSEERSPFLSLRRDWPPAASPGRGWTLWDSVHLPMDRLFDDFFRSPMSGSGLGRPAMGWPSLEVSEADGEVRVTAELPGLGEKDVELTVNDGMLTLRGEKKSESQDKDRGWSERFYGRFERRIALPDGVDEEGCKADFRDGILTVTMPKSEQAQRSRRIPINADTRH
ncbi:Hsp20/alpha crystallin family protein [Allosphingosinicella sp.]|uniref:Hsp20/alpha crystallin family protein n=1 Tax=Allosphingosinicella sp. TaxID=2823234 RepID=UPI002F1B5930